MPIPNADLFAYDSWLCAMHTRLSGQKILDEPLQYHRRHGNNSSAFLASRITSVNSLDLVMARKHQDPRPWCQRRLQQLDALRARIDKKGISTLTPLGLEDRIPQALHSIDFEISATRVRLRLLQKPRIKRILPALIMYTKGQYAVFSGWKSLVKDLYIA
jgi:hypothetical protein